jgi:hypothetical protein
MIGRSPSILALFAARDWQCRWPLAARARRAPATRVRLPPLSARPSLSRAGASRSGTDRDRRCRSRVVVQVNDGQGTAVPGAPVEMQRRAAGVTLRTQPRDVTDSSGQVTTNVTLGGMAGRFRFIGIEHAHQEREKQGRPLTVDEIALGYEQEP